MKVLLTALAGAALLSAPLAAAAHDFGGAAHGGFAPHAAAPAFGGGGFARGGFEPHAAAAPVFRGGFDHGGFVGRPYGPAYRGGFHYGVGGFVPALYWDAYLADPVVYGLDAAPFSYHWVQVGDQALLIQDGTGAVVQAVAI